MSAYVGLSTTVAPASVGPVACASLTQAFANPGVERLTYEGIWCLDGLSQLGITGSDTSLSTPACTAAFEWPRIQGSSDLWVDDFCCMPQSGISGIEISCSIEPAGGSWGEFQSGISGIEASCSVYNPVASFETAGGSGGEADGAIHCEAHDLQKPVPWTCTEKQSHPLQNEPVKIVHLCAHLSDTAMDQTSKASPNDKACAVSSAEMESIHDEVKDQMDIMTSEAMEDKVQTVDESDSTESFFSLPIAMWPSMVLH